MAVWMGLAGLSVIDKVVAIIFPVAAGFEHSIANMYFIPMGLMIKTFGDAGATADAITWFGFLSNLAPVVLGNLAGGGLLVDLVYHIIYRRRPVHVQLSPGPDSAVLFFSNIGDFTFK